MGVHLVIPIMAPFWCLSESRPFRVYILLPLLPAFEGEPGGSSGVAIHYILHFARISLFMGPNALLPRLARHMAHPEDYVSVCSLRTYDRWPDGRLP
ncbi:unnamed protein product [Protopolystoma xenopodis]|uniref:Uncharacterized protein n=1 Tax=Protopolystoma xenopodis TaxID=117903 RepID=A0A448XIX5_9PLAT|nr:unnamed protein product [Protopolystoma xenopodis]